jgi:AcrR family transcriptional regulator
MSPRQGLDREKVIAAAAELVDREGPESLTVARVAAHLHVRPPSLYNHVASLEQLEVELAVRGLAELAVRLRRAATGLAGFDALRAVSDAYRACAAEHRGLYALGQRARTENERYAAVAAEVVEIVLAVLRGYGLQGAGALHAARCLRSALHGFVTLENTGGFGLPLRLDESFARLVRLLHEGLSTLKKEERI